MVGATRWKTVDGERKGMEDEARDGRTLKMKLLPNILLTLSMFAIGEFGKKNFNNETQYRHQVLRMIP